MTNLPHAPLIRAFVKESNRIEGIHRQPTVGEIKAHVAFLALQTVTVADVEEFVRAVAGAPMRREVGMNVRVGNHFPPKGGPHIERELKHIVWQVNAGATPFVVHRAYETLHPFMDGNGRSGRVLWLWQMVNQDHGDPHALRRGFLHSWYYQSLGDAR